MPTESWWTGDENSDPWEWKIILSRDPSVTYRKFFNKSVGFAPFLHALALPEQLSADQMDDLKHARNSLIHNVSCISRKGYKEQVTGRKKQ